MSRFIEIHNQKTRMFVNVDEIQTLVDRPYEGQLCTLKLREHQPFRIDEDYMEVRKRIRASIIVSTEDLLGEGKA